MFLASPCQDVKRRRIVAKLINVPSRDEFQKLVAAIRSSDGRLSCQEKAKEGAELVELLACSRSRLDETRNLRWQGIPLKHKRITITGGERGIRNPEFRTVPMTDGSS